MKILKQLAPVLSAALLAGCATEPTRLEATYGDSVRRLVSEQIADPHAVDRRVRTPTLDGRQGEQVLQEHRTDVARPEEVSNDIIFNVGK